MTSNARYHLKRHHKFKQGNCKYIADLETNDIFQVNDIEWDILNRYDSQTPYQIVEGLKEKYKIVSIFNGIERLERLGKQGYLLCPTDEAAHQPSATWKQTNKKPRVLVPIHFTREKSSLDYITNLNRYHLLTHLSKFAELEVLTFSKVGEEDRENKEIQSIAGEIGIRNIEVRKNDTFATPWYAMNGYDGILLLSQYLADDLLYYHVHETPIVHCIGGNQKLQDLTLEMLLNIQGLQKANDTVVLKASWLKDPLGEFDMQGKGIRVIPDGIAVSEPIGKELAKQHTAALFDNPMFAKQPVVGLISGFEPYHGVQLISAFAHANPHLSIFVYDSLLAEHYTNPPSNVVIFSVDDEETHSILPIFFQALDLVCFPTVPGTPLSLVLEAMAYGTPCIALSQYGLPEEVEGAGIAVEVEGNGLGHFYVSLSQLSETVNRWLEPYDKRTECESVAQNLIQRYTWEKAAQEIVQLFELNCHTKQDNSRIESDLFPPIFCRRYNPVNRETASCVYRPQTGRYESLETTLVERLEQQHTATEVEIVKKHFQEERSTPSAKHSRPGNGVPTNIWNPKSVGTEHRQKGDT